jgi:magnesium-transporting ATPase (P-type)
MQIEKNQKEEVNIEQLYGKECILSKEEFVKQYHVNEKGLSSNEAETKIHKYGLNEIRQAKPKKWYNYLLESLFSPFNSILLRNCCHTLLYRCLPS